MKHAQIWVLEEKHSLTKSQLTKLYRYKWPNNNKRQIIMHVKLTKFHKIDLQDRDPKLRRTTLVISLLNT